MKRRKINIFAAYLLVALSALGCAKNNPDDIIRNTIDRYGGEKFKNSIIEFDFRGNHFVIYRKSGKYEYTKIGKDSTGKIIEEKLTASGYTRKINGEPIDLSEKKKNALANSLNSVIYFALLPYPLADKAVLAKIDGTAEIKGRKYYRLRVNFKQEGGGDDYQDKYLYWIDTEDYSMDYFAYSFEVNGGGSRFREVTNERKINGIILTDHINYKIGKEISDLTEYESEFNNGKLIKVSEIRLENPSVRLL